MEPRMLQVRDHVVFVDAVGKRHEALLTEVWGEAAPCSVNLVYVSGDPSKTDPYGRQIERETSVVHKSYQSAHGMYWAFADEVGME